ncbi:MAG: response regulator [Desulfobacterales bacterium]|nr:response regulator [Desulfobacterales bacterium]
MQDNKPKGKILVTDDRQNWRELLDDILSGDGHEVETADSLKKATELLKNKTFDIAIIDMRLIDASPYNIDGIKVLKEAKAQQPSIKAVILTGYPDEKQKNKALNFYKADSYCEKAPDGKPFDIDEFSSQIFKLLSS